MLDSSTVFAKYAVPKLGCEAVQDVVKNVTINRVHYRVQSVPIYYRIIVMMWCGQSGGEESRENERLFDEQHGRR